MNKTKIILAAIGGTILLAVLVAAGFIWVAWSDRVAALEGDDETGADGLETVRGRAQTLSRKPVYPCAESVQEIAANRDVVVGWREEAFRLASRGDRLFAATTPAAFKEFIVRDARRVAALPGAEGPLVEPSFAFGPFKDYIAEGKMPAEADLPALQRQWDDVATVAETLSSCGIVRLTGVSVGVSAAEKAAREEEAKPAKGRRKPPKKSARAAREKPETLPPSSYTYVFTFTTRPAAFLKCVNALTAAERFFVVEDFSFHREKDVVAEALGGDEKKKDAEAAASSTRRRGRRGGRAAQAEKKEDEPAKGGLVTDPQQDPPLVVTLTVATYDFRSMDEAKEGGK